MKQTLSSIRARSVAARPGDINPDAWLGASPGFSTIDGKALAADLECLRQARNFKLYLGRAASWGEFCTRYVGASQRQVNMAIQQLEEFGPQFFHLMQLMRIPPDAYRAIAGHVTVDGIFFEGERIPLTIENGRKLTDAVAELCRSHSASEQRVLVAGG